MDITKCFALQTGSVELPDGEAAELIVEDLGTLRVPSGRLAICDAIWLETPAVVEVPPGEYGVRLTKALVPEEYDLRGQRNAYLSLVRSEAQAVRLEPATVERDSVDWRDTPAGGVAGVAGLVGVPTTMYNVAMVDAEAIETGMPEDADTWYESVISGWFDLMDTDTLGPHGTVNIVLPRATAGESIAIVLGRGGDWQFPLLASFDAAGELIAVHVDLLIIGELAERLEAFDGRDPNAVSELELRAEAEQREAEAEQRRRDREADERAKEAPGFAGFWARLTRR